MNKLKKFLERTFQVFAIAGLLSFSFITPAFATVLVSSRITLTDSRVSTVHDETIVIVLSASNTFAAAETILYDWPADFTFPTNATWVTGDFTFNDGTGRTITDVGATPTCNAGVNNVAVTTNQTNKSLSVEACSTYTPSAAGATVTFTAGGLNITNPGTTGSKIVSIDETTDDAKNSLVMITNGVTLSASVAETLTFTVAGANVATCTITGGTEVDTSGDATTVPFGNLSSDAFKDACQQLTVGTNGSGGYSTTVQTTSLPTSGGNTIAKGVCDAACTDTAEAAWATATNNGYGYCMDDTTGNGAETADAGWGTNFCGAGSQFFKTAANAGAAQTAISVMSSATATAANDIALIGYRISVGAGQAAGSYTTTIVYIATPTF